MKVYLALLRIILHILEARGHTIKVYEAGTLAHCVITNHRSDFIDNVFNFIPDHITREEGDKIIAEIDYHYTQLLSVTI